MIKVVRNFDGKIFTSEVQNHERISQIEFYHSSTCITVYELGPEGKLKFSEIRCNTEPPNDAFEQIFTKDNYHLGEFIKL